jgi:predicted nucleic-acid-binding Zn-ribbon protein
MSEDNKLCPKCNTPMEEQLGCVVPLEIIGLGQKPISTQQGLKVMPYHCPKCRYLELYSTGALIREGVVEVPG